MSTITIKDLNAFATLSELEAKSIVGGLKTKKVVKVIYITQIAINFALFAGTQSINQVAIIA